MATPWTAPREWEGDTAILLGGGPSLGEFPNLGELLAGRERRVIAINNSWELCPDAEILYACDGSWWERHLEGVRREFRGRWLVTVSKTVREPRVLRMSIATRERGLSRKPDALVFGGHSGYQAINLAYLLGARRIALLGFDYVVQQGPQASGHWHEGHPHQKLDRFAYRLTKVFLPHLRALAAPLASEGVEVFNVRPPKDPGTAIDWWPRASFEDAVGGAIPANAHLGAPAVTERLHAQ